MDLMWFSWLLTVDEIALSGDKNISHQRALAPDRPHCTHWLPSLWPLCQGYCQPSTAVGVDTAEGSHLPGSLADRRGTVSGAELYSEHLWCCWAASSGQRRQARDYRSRTALGLWVTWQIEGTRQGVRVRDK